MKRNFAFWLGRLTVSVALIILLYCCSAFAGDAIGHFACVKTPDGYGVVISQVIYDQTKKRDWVIILDHQQEKTYWVDELTAISCSKFMDIAERPVRERLNSMMGE